MSRKHVPEEHGEKVPIWIISFADMITLLLAFFVMLQTMSHDKSNAMMTGARDSFVASLSHLGLPDFFFPSDEKTPVNYRHLRYPDEAPEASLPATGHPEDPVGRFMEQIKRTLDVSPGAAATPAAATYPLSGQGSGSTGPLEMDARKSIGELIRQIAPGLTTTGCELTVAGLACDIQDARQQWLVSVRRAGETEKLIRQELSRSAPHMRLKITSLGLGAPAKYSSSKGAQCSFAIVALTRGG